MAEYCPYNLLLECHGCHGSKEINDQLTQELGPHWPGDVWVGKGISPQATDIKQRAIELIKELGLICADSTSIPPLLRLR